jgi:hypothetical protein
MAIRVWARVRASSGAKVEPEAQGGHPGVEHQVAFLEAEHVGSGGGVRIAHRAGRCFGPLSRTRGWFAASRVIDQNGIWRVSATRSVDRRSVSPPARSQSRCRPAINPPKDQSSSQRSRPNVARGQITQKSGPRHGPNESHLQRPARPGAGPTPIPCRPRPACLNLNGKRAGHAHPHHQ